MAGNGYKVEITKEVVEASAGDYAEVVQWFRTSLNSQRAWHRKNVLRSATWARLSATIIILLGFVASSAAIFSKAGSVWPWGGERYWALLNVLVPLVISASTAVFALFDFRSAHARHSSAYSAISAIKAQIDYQLLLGLKDEKRRITREMLADWEKKTDAAVTQHVRAWERSIVETKTKE